MRRHYQSLNYLDGDPVSSLFRVGRTQGTSHAVIEAMSSRSNFSYAMTRVQTEALRDMLNEVLEDWK